MGIVVLLDGLVATTPVLNMERVDSIPVGRPQFLELTKRCKVKLGTVHAANVKTALDWQ